MLFDWSRFMPAWFNAGVGMFGLGPYFNLLPVLTIILFIWQQKMFMPPAADEQAAMQQKMMKYMMIFMGLMFFKVASGLCIYFIASSLWGLGERRFLPKAAPVAGGSAREDPGSRRRRQRRLRREPRPGQGPGTRCRQTEEEYVGCACIPSTTRSPPLPRRRGARSAESSASAGRRPSSASTGSSGPMTDSPSHRGGFPAQ